MAKLAKIKQNLRSPRFRKVRKIIVTIVGVVVILAGIVLIFIPGPAFVVIPAGFAILAIEFEWAQRWVKKMSSPAYLKRLLYENSLSLALFGLFLLCLFGQMVAGHQSYNQERQTHGEFPVCFVPYLFSGHFIEATFENWESEFLQMGALVWMTVFLHQKGAADSKKLGDHHPLNVPTRPSGKTNSPWPARQGGWVLKVYEHSLTLVLLALFLVSFLLHAAGGVHEYNEDQFRHGESSVSMLGYMATSRFWFESFQNWQSEFLSVAVLLVLSIFLRQKGSPQSKPVNAPDSQTGER